jgi:hypothetical protein
MKALAEEILQFEGKLYLKRGQTFNLKKHKTFKFSIFYDIICTFHKFKAI